MLNKRELQQDTVKQYLCALQQGYVLLFPSSDVLSVEPYPGQDINESTGYLNEDNCIQFQDSAIPLISLNSKLRFTRQIDPQTSVALIFQYENKNFALTSQSVKLIAINEVQTWSLPNCMREDQSMPDKIGVVESTTAFILSRKILWRYFSALAQANLLPTKKFLYPGE